MITVDSVAMTIEVGKLIARIAGIKIAVSKGRAKMDCKTCKYKRPVVNGKKQWFCPFENKRVYLNGKCGKDCPNHSDNFKYLKNTY